MDYHLQIFKRDLEESLEIENKTKLRDDEYDRLRRKDTEVRCENQKMKTTDHEIINI